MKRHPIASAKSGFTLIELLVVISIISLLIALLLPSLDAARQQTRITLCASNLHQFSAAIFAHAADNQGESMVAYRRAPGWNDPTTIGIRDSGENYWNVETINRYIQSFNEEYKTGTGIIICPSTDEGWYQSFVEAFYQSTSGFTQMTYSYFGGADRWDSPETHLHNSAPEDLADTRLVDPGRVLMNDSIMFDPSTNLFRYNHGKGGWAYNWPPRPGPYVQDSGPTPSLTGINQLRADGSARWKAASDFPYLDQMTNPVDTRNAGGGRGGGRGGSSGGSASGYLDGWVGLGTGARYY